MDAETGTGEVRTVLVVDVANVMGSRPDGWWRDRAGAAERLVRRLAAMAGTAVPAPADLPGPVLVDRVVAVVEGQARQIPDVAGVELVRAPADGDTSVVEVCGEVLRRDPRDRPLVVTADRGLRQRLPPGSWTAGPRWLLDHTNA